MEKFFTFPKYKVFNIGLYIVAVVYFVFVLFLLLSFFNLDILTHMAGIENTEGMPFCTHVAIYYPSALKTSRLEGGQQNRSFFWFGFGFGFFVCFLCLNNMTSLYHGSVRILMLQLL